MVAPIPGPAELLTLVQRSSRDEFAAAFPHYFLVGTLRRARMAQRTDVIDFSETSQENTTAKSDRAGALGLPMILPLRKCRKNIRR